MAQEDDKSPKELEKKQPKILLWNLASHTQLLQLHRCCTLDEELLGKQIYIEADVISCESPKYCPSSAQ